MSVDRSYLLLLSPLRGGEEPDPADGGTGGEGNVADDDADEDDLAGILDPKDRRIAELSREAGRHRRNKNAALTDNQKLQDRIRELENQGGDQSKNWETEKATMQARYEELERNTANTLLRAAMVEDAKYQWYDVPVVLNLINREAIDVDLAEGVVDGLGEELKRIAKEKPYLVKKSTEKASEKTGNASGSGGTGTPQTGSTGSNPGNNGASNGQAAQRATLESKYPSLRNI